MGGAWPSSSRGVHGHQRADSRGVRLLLALRRCRLGGDVLHHLHPPVRRPGLPQVLVALPLVVTVAVTPAFVGSPGGGPATRTSSSPKGASCTRPGARAATAPTGGVSRTSRASVGPPWRTRARPPPTTCPPAACRSPTARSSPRTRIRHTARRRSRRSWRSSAPRQRVDVPDVDPEAGDLAVGGEVFRANCQACHGAAGTGGALSYGRAAPRSHRDAEADRLGRASGAREMPVFGPDVIDDDELNGLVRYVEYLQDPRARAACRSAGPGPSPRISWPGSSAWWRCWAWSRGSVRAARSAGPAGASRDRLVALTNPRRWPQPPRADDERAPRRERRARRRGRLPAGDGRRHRPHRRLLGGRAATGRGHPARRGAGRDRGRHRPVGEALHADGGGGGGSPPWSPARRTSPRSPPTSRRAAAPLQRRRVLVATAGGACAALGGALVPHPVTGPAPGAGFKQTPTRAETSGSWTKTVCRCSRDLPVDGFITVWPDGHTDDADASTLLIHFRATRTSSPRRAARTGRSTTSSPTPSSAPTWAARWACTRPGWGCCCARATSRRSTSCATPSPFWPRRPVTAPAAARRRRRRLHHRHRRLLRPGRPGSGTGR